MEISKDLMLDTAEGSRKSLSNYYSSMINYNQSQIDSESLMNDFESYNNQPSIISNNQQVMNNNCLFNYDLLPNHDNFLKEEALFNKLPGLWNFDDYFTI
jgi:hypothetical protein